MTGFCMSGQEKKNQGVLPSTSKNVASICHNGEIKSIQVDKRYRFNSLPTILANLANKKNLKVETKNRKKTGKTLLQTII